MPFLMNVLSSPAFWKGLGILVISAALFIGGCKHGEQNIQTAWDAEKFTEAKAHQVLLGVQDEITNQVIQGYVDKINTIRATTKVITKKVNVYVPANSCPLPPGFRLLHNAAAAGRQLSDSSSGSDAAAPAADPTGR